ncbi:MAG: hypothetical protein IKN52_02325, partial [Victivallales bacterium]|nr:hypothetical protein [Victivallales bacterium]
MVEGIGKRPDMPIQGGMNPGNIGGATGEKAAGMKELKNDKGLTETQLAKTNSLFGAGAPDLEKPSGATANTKDVADQIINALGQLNSADSGKGLFVLFQILQMLQEALNKMQQSMQVMRQAETNVAIAQIESEAQTMKDAAEFGLVLGIISGIVQIGASAFSMYSGFKGVTNTLKAKATGEQLKTAQTDMATLKTELGTQKTEMGTLKTEMGTLKSELTTLQGAEAPDANAIAAKQTEINTKQAEITTKQQAIDTKQGEIADKQFEMMGMKTKMDMQLSTAQSESNKGQAIGQFIGAIGGFAKTIGDGIASSKQADAKRIEGQIKQMEEGASKTADL